MRLRSRAQNNESLAGGTRSRVPPSFHSGVAITAPRSGAFLTGLATALGPGSRRYRVGAMLTLLRVPLFLVHGERFALALTLVSLKRLGALVHIGVRDGAFIVRISDSNMR